MRRADKIECHLVKVVTRVPSRLTRVHLCSNHTGKLFADLAFSSRLVGVYRPDKGRSSEHLNINNKYDSLCRVAGRWPF